MALLFRGSRSSSTPPTPLTGHDIAGALYYEGVYHVFQGCAAFGGVAAGWHHATSTNLVDWHNLGIEPGLSAIAEPYGTSSPCSGFMVVDDDGVPCAGFRECGGQWPGRTNVQVPLELRCAKNAELTSWSGPEYIFVRARRADAAIGGWCAEPCVSDLTRRVVKRLSPPAVVLLQS